MSGVNVKIPALASTTREISLAQVEQHASDDDLWLIVDGKVYDASEYMHDHPGGAEIMLNSSGKDATEDFEDVGHSAKARDDLRKLQIGVFTGGESSRSDGGKGKTSKGNKGMTNAGGGGWAAVALPILVVLLAVLAAMLGSGK